MDVLDKFLKQYSYKFDKGYPDMNNPKDKEMLFEFAYKLIKEKELIKEGSEEYDRVIKNKLKVEEIPTSKNKYPWPGAGQGSFSFQVQQDDMDIWQQLWTAKPPKKTGDKTETLGVGKGEISLYWLYNFSNSGVTVEEGREGDDPDLFFGNDRVGVEVKAYPSHTGKNKIGRFGSDKDNLKLLSVIFGIDALVKVLQPGEKQKTINPFNFAGTDLKGAMDQLMLMQSVDLGALAQRYDLFKTIQSNIDLVQSGLGGFSDPMDGALSMGKKMLNDKLGRKPGNGGYLASVKLSGDCKFFGIDLAKIDNEGILDNMSVTQAALNLNFDKTFG
tara:strand:- start:818 stop:1807 length:990 start_codon:yes stop_codon:yes gene_type:complete